jgi:hypothetical protein
MDDKYDLKGCVRRMAQRNQRNFALHGLDQKPNHDSFDVEFSPTGQVLRRTDYTYGSEVCRSYRFEYDDAGRLIRSLEFDSIGAEKAVSELVYSEGKCAWSSRDAVGIVTGRGLDEYVGERLILSSTFDTSGRPRVLKSFEYSEGLLSQSVSKFYGYDGKCSQQWITRYDAAGRVAETFGLKADGSPLGDGKYAYEYDAEGRRIKVWSFNDWEVVSSAVTISEYVYDESGNWIERNDYHRSKSDSHSTRRVTTRTLTYYSAGKSHL